MGNPISGIYKITNIKTNKIYIGSSININYRFTQHKYNLVKNIHKNTHMQSAYNKYGKDSFLFEILEHCEKENLIERELYWIKKLDSMNREIGYNFQLAGNNNLGYIQGQKTIEKKNLKIKKKICQYDINGVLLKEWDSLIEAARFYNIHETGILCCCKGRKQKRCIGFVWRYKNDSFDKFNSNVSKHTPKKVLLYSKDNVLLKEFSSIHKASVYTGVHKLLISQYINNVKSQPNNYNFITK